MELSGKDSTAPKRISPQEAHELKEYSLDLFARVQETLLREPFMDEEHRKRSQELADGFAELIELVRK